MWGAIIGLIGAAASLYGSYKQSESIKENAEAQGKSAEQAAAENRELSLMDAEVMERAAREEMYKTGVALQMYTTQMDNWMGALRTSAAKSGVAVGTGTPLDVEVYSKKNFIKDLEMIKYNGMKATEQKYDLAKRYRKLADYGLRDAAAYATAVLETAKDQANASLVTGIGKTASNIYTVGTNLDWF
jgi:hypothetical protein